MIPSESEFPFQPSSKIHCTCQVGFGFEFVENLLIENLSFTNCGTPVSLMSKRQATSLFHEVTNLTISHVIVQNSTGYGVFGVALNGDSRIFESAFLYNHGDENYLGGNIFILLDTETIRTGTNCNSPGNNTPV